MALFRNPAENRLRAGWRIFLFIFVSAFLGIAAGNIAGGYSFQMIMAGGMLIWYIIATISIDNISVRLPDYKIFRLFAVEFSLGCLIGFVAVSFIFILLYLLGFIEISSFNWQKTAFSYSPLLVYLLGMMGVAVTEEVSFRGYLLRNLAEGLSGNTALSKRGIFLGVFLTSGFFGFAHILNPAAHFFSTLNISLAGVMLALPVLATGRISFAIGIHGAWNFTMAAVFGFKMSGTSFPHPLVTINRTGPEIWTGGMFGPEGGLSGILGMLLIVVLTMLYAKKINGVWLPKKLQVHLFEEKS